MRTSTKPPVPEGCHAGGSEGCVPEPAWVQELCDDVFAEVALVMFRAGTPWQRRYVRRRVEAVNASGGVTVNGHLERDEEVIVLRHRPAREGGIVVGGGSEGAYDALRFNGSCVSLDASELSVHEPAQPRHARVEWRWLGPKMKASLRASPAIREAYRARRKECRGATRGSVSRACQKLDEELIAVIVREVRGGLPLGEADERPGSP